MKFYFSLSTGLCGLIFKRSIAGKNLHPSSALPVLPGSHLQTLHSMRAQSHPPLCGPMDCNSPGSSVHGIFQARILVWVAISHSRGIFQTQESNLHLRHLLRWQENSLPLCSGKPKQGVKQKVQPGHLTEIGKVSINSNFSFPWLFKGIR